MNVWAYVNKCFSVFGPEKMLNFFPLWAEVSVSSGSYTVCWKHLLRHRHLSKSWRRTAASPGSGRGQQHTSQSPRVEAAFRCLFPHPSALCPCPQPRVIDGCVFLRISSGHLLAASATRSKSNTQENLLNL